MQELPNLYKPILLFRLPLRGRGRLRAPPVAGGASKKEWQNQGDWRACFARDDRAADSTGRGMPHPYIWLVRSTPPSIHYSQFTVLCSLFPVLTITRSACRKCSARGSFYAFFSYFGIPRQLRERCALLPRMKHDTGVSVPTRLVVLAVTCFFSLPLLLT